MYTKKKTIYYCDYCKKHSMRNLSKHELSCTLNPKRLCKMCKLLGYHDHTLVDDIIARICAIPSVDDGSGYKHIKIDDNTLYKDIDGCPACVSTIVRRCWEYGKYNHITFNFDVDLQKI